MKLRISYFENKFDNQPRHAVRDWAQLLERFRSPAVRSAKDGPLFSPATFQPAFRLARNVLELSLLVLDAETPADPNRPASPLDIDAVMAGLTELNCAAVAHSTHSHLLMIPCDKCVKQLKHGNRADGGLIHTGNPTAEPRYRIVIPLSSPIPAKDFPRLWQWAAREISGLHVDESAKDASRIYYTPAKATEQAPYESRALAGEFFDWRLRLNGGSAVRTDRYGTPPVPIGEAQMRVERVADVYSGEPGTIIARVNGFVKVQWDNAAAPALVAHDQVRLIETTPKLSGKSPDFAWHEDRHEELTRRIIARGKVNGRGHYDARCLAHGGKGATALCYFPENGSVSCNAGCDYFALLKAEGLSDRKLPSKDRAARFERTAALRAGEASAASIIQNSKLQTQNFFTPAPISAARLHVIYGALLAHLLNLTPKDEAAIVDEMEIDPFGRESIEHPLTGIKRPIKICSMPSSYEAAVAVNKLSEWFDLSGVPGFYRDAAAGVPAMQPSAQRRRWLTEQIGEWRLNITCTGGLLGPVVDPQRGYIVSLRQYRSVRDRKSFLVTSRGLPGGARSVYFKEEVAA